VQDCQVCGRSFDPLGFQVVVPELGRGFDRIECAQSARALAGPGSRLAATPLVAIVEPVSAALMPTAVGSAPALRPLGTPAATLGLLAAGTAAAVFLWLRVLGADPSSFTLGRLAAPPAFSHETVQTHVEAAPAGINGKPAPARTANRVTELLRGPGPAGTAPGEPGGGSSNPPPPSQPSPPSSPTPARPPASEPDDDDDDDDDHGHKHGKGHSKHGEEDGVHSPGHGHHGHGEKQGKKHDESSGKDEHHGKKHDESSGKGEHHGKKHDESSGKGEHHGKKHHGKNHDEGCEKGDED
jgi:hypothetical protein